MTGSAQSPAWIELEGVVNMRDLGGLPTTDGRVTRPGRLIRSDNLQDLSPDAVRRLLDLGVSDVVDLRSSVEVTRTGAGPLRRDSDVRHGHFSLLPEPDPDAAESDAFGRALGTSEPDPGPDSPRPAGDSGRSDSPRPESPEPPTREPGEPEPEAPPARPDHDAFWSGHYLGYLRDRPESVIGALRAIAWADGASVCHCAAGKDRTGTITAMALELAGVRREAIVADFAASAERVPRILQRLAATEAYRDSVSTAGVAQQSTQAATMRLVLREIDERFGGVQAYLARHGWTDADTAAMRHKLLDD